MQNIITKPRNRQERNASKDLILQAYKCKVKTRDELLKLHRKICEKYKINFLSNPILLVTYHDLIKNKTIKASDQLFQILRKRRVRTASGIASVAILTKPFPCPGKCIYCPTELDMPKSYLANEPAVMRAVLAKFDPYQQVQIRLRGFEIAGNSAEKIELIVMGGTWSALPKDYQIKFIIACLRACNEYGSKIRNPKFKYQMKLKAQMSKLLEILKKEQKKNESAKYRVVGLTLETRPDYINPQEIKWMRQLGCTRVELGVQTIYDRVLNKNQRGHLVSATISATKLLKDAGFKVCYHLMPNLYGSDLKTDLQMFKTIFSDQNFQPDLIKIYPCVVTKHSRLYSLFKAGMYKSYTDKELAALILKIKKIIPPYVRIQRLIRDIPAESIESGSKVSNLRQILQTKMQKMGIKCQCIRCREIGEHKKLPVKLARIDYQASDGQEIFLQYVDKYNRLYALLRLRIPSNIFRPRQSAMNSLSASVSDCTAVIREVHTYGQMVAIGEKIKKDSQHQGLGKKLLLEAEKITKREFGQSKIRVIAGVGVRDYYRQLGYKLQNTYMTKEL